MITSRALKSVVGQCKMLGYKLDLTGRGRLSPVPSPSDPELASFMGANLGAVPRETIPSLS